jgi:PDZ domain-containing secreted protein
MNQPLRKGSRSWLRRTLQDDHPTLEKVSHTQRNSLGNTAILWGTLLVVGGLVWLGFGSVAEVSVGPGGIVNLARAVQVGKQHPRKLKLFDAQLSVSSLTPLQFLIGHLNPNLTFVSPLHNQSKGASNTGSTNLQAALSAAVAAYRYLGMPIKATRGLLVRDVLPQSPAKAIIHPGDLITSVNGLPVSNLLNFETALTSRPRNSTVTLTLDRQSSGLSQIIRRQVQVPFNEGKLGIIITTASLYELPTALHISIPKALDGTEGLAEALAIIDSTRHLHLKHSLSIGMIGLVSPDGKLKPVFGIEQRVAAMRAGHLRYVLVPLVQRQSAERASHGTIAVIGVTYLSQAVQEVERLARAKTPKEVVR